jgi:hypothetical protein
VVVDDVEQHLDVAPVTLGHQHLEVLLAAETRIQPGEIVGPVAVVGPVGKTGAADEAVDVLDHRRDPDGGRAERGDPVELPDQALDVTAVEGPLRGPIHRDVVAGVAVGKPVGDDEVDHCVRPVALGRHHHRRSAFGERLRPFRGRRRGTAGQHPDQSWQ